MKKVLGKSPLCKLSGKVVYGRGIGKLVGMPTANLEVSSDIKLPPNGVYAAKVLYDNYIYYRVTNLGTRPTIDNDSEISIETYILDFNREIYGEMLEVELLKMIRNIKKFEDYFSLLEQIRKDCITAQDFFGIKRTYLRLQMDIEKHQAKFDNHEIYLSSKEFDVLYMMYSNPDVSFTKEQIYEAIWHEPALGCCHAVENTIFQIRKKFKAINKNLSFIKTVVGYGYKFDVKNCY